MLATTYIFITRLKCCHLSRNNSQKFHIFQNLYGFFLDKWDFSRYADFFWISGFFISPGFWKWICQKWKFTYINNFYIWVQAKRRECIIINGSIWNKNGEVGFWMLPPNIKGKVRRPGWPIMGILFPVLCCLLFGNDIPNFYIIYCFEVVFLLF